MGKKGEGLPGRVPVREKVRELAGLFFFLAALFLLISLVTYDPGDLGEIRYPPHAPAHNKGGAVGARLAYVLLSGFGLGAYPLVFFTGFWAFLIFFRRRLEGLAVKLVSAGISVLAASALLSLQGLAGPADFGLEGTAPGLGGAYGKALEIALVRHLGTAGAWLAVALGLAVSLVLSTDWMIYRAALGAGRGGRAVLGRLLRYWSAEERARREIIDVYRNPSTAHRHRDPARIRRGARVRPAERAAFLQARTGEALR